VSGHDWKVEPPCATLDELREAAQAFSSKEDAQRAVEAENQLARYRLVVEAAQRWRASGCASPEGVDLLRALSALDEVKP